MPDRRNPSVTEPLFYVILMCYCIYSEVHTLIKILRNLKKKDMMFLLCAVGLIVCQVWLDLKMPDYTAKLTESVSSGNIFRDEILRNGNWGKAGA